MPFRISKVNSWSICLLSYVNVYYWGENTSPVFHMPLQHNLQLRKWYKLREKTSCENNSGLSYLRISLKTGFLIYDSVSKYLGTVKVNLKKNKLSRLRLKPRRNFSKCHFQTRPGCFLRAMFIHLELTSALGTLWLWDLIQLFFPRAPWVLCQTSQGIFTAFVILAECVRVIYSDDLFFELTVFKWSCTDNSQ